MDLVDVVPVLNLYDQSWPIRTLQPQLPPPKFVHFAPGGIGEARRGEAVDSMVCAGSIISGGHVRHSILSPNVRVNSYAMVEDSILFEGVNVGRKAENPAGDHRQGCGGTGGYSRRLRSGLRPSPRIHGDRKRDRGHRQGGDDVHVFEIVR